MCWFVLQMTMNSVLWKYNIQPLDFNSFIKNSMQCFFYYLTLKLFNYLSTQCKYCNEFLYQIMSKAITSMEQDSMCKTVN